MQPPGMKAANGDFSVALGAWNGRVATAIIHRRRGRCALCAVTRSALGPTIKLESGSLVCSCHGNLLPRSAIESLISSQREVESGAFVDVPFRPNCAAMSFDDTLDQCETHACPFELFDGVQATKNAE